MPTRTIDSPAAEPTAPDAAAFRPMATVWADLIRGQKQLQALMHIVGEDAADLHQRQYEWDVKKSEREKSGGFSPFALVSLGARPVLEGDALRRCTAFHALHGVISSYEDELSEVRSIEQRRAHSLAMLSASGVSESPIDGLELESIEVRTAQQRKAEREALLSAAGIPIIHA